MAVYTQPGGAGTPIYFQGTGVTLAGICAAFPADAHDYGYRQYELDVQLVSVSGVTTTWNQLTPFSLILPNITYAIRAYNGCTIAWGNNVGEKPVAGGGKVTWRLTAADDAIRIESGAKLYCYGMVLGSYGGFSGGGHMQARPGGGMYFRGCTISAGHNLLTYYGSSVGAVERCNISIASRGLVLRSSPTMSDIELNNFASNQTLISVQDYNVTAYRVRAYNSTNAYVYNFSGVYIKLRNCNLGQFRKANLNANGRIYQEMSFDLNYRDANNAYIENVIITIKDRFGATFYSGPTDANGDLIQQWLLYDQFVGTSETRTYYFPYVITAEKAGYITDTFNHIPSSDGFVGNVFTRTLYAVGDQTDPTFDDTGLAAVQNDDAIDLTIPAGTSNSGPTGVMYAVYMKEDADPTPGTAGNLFSADFLQITNDLTLAITQKVGGDLLTDGEYRIAVLCVDYIGNVTGGVTVVTVNYVAPVPTLPPQVEDGSVDFETPPAVTGGSVTDPYPPAVAGAYIS